MGSTYGKVQLINLIKLCSNNTKDYNRICCLSQQGKESHQWLQVLPTDQYTLKMNNRTMIQAIRYRLGLNPYDITPPICLCGKKDVYQQDPYHSLSCSALRSHGTNMRHYLLVKNIADWIRKTGAIVRTEVTGMSSKDNKRPDIVFWYDNKQCVVDVTVTDPFNSTNTKTVGPPPISKHRNQSHYFDLHAAKYDIVYSTMEKRKDKHYKELVDANQEFCETTFYTAGAFTTGGLCCDFNKLIQEISVIAQRETSGWDPSEIASGVRGSIAAAIQTGNAFVLNESWNRIASRNYDRLLKPEREKCGMLTCDTCIVNMERSTTKSISIPWMDIGVFLFLSVSVRLVELLL